MATMKVQYQPNLGTQQKRKMEDKENANPLAKKQRMAWEMENYKVKPKYSLMVIDALPMKVTKNGQRVARKQVKKEVSPPVPVQDKRQQKPAAITKIQAAAKVEKLPEFEEVVQKNYHELPEFEQIYRKNYQVKEKPASPKLPERPPRRFFSKPEPVWPEDETKQECKHSYDRYDWEVLHAPSYSQLDGDLFAGPPEKIDEDEPQDEIAQRCEAALGKWDTHFAGYWKKRYYY